jgi:MipA family protein
MRRFFCLALTACCLSSPVFAQSQPAAGALPSPEEVANRNNVTVGVGGAVVPDYEGSDDYRIIPAVAIRGKVGGISFSTRGTYLYLDVVPAGAGQVELDAGPIAGFRLNKRRHVKDDIVELLPKTKTAFEVGGFAGVSLHGLTNPYDTLAFRVDVTHALNAYKGTSFAPNIEFSTPLSRTTYAGLSVGAEFVGNKYADYYYTITPADSLVSGLPVFNADGGLKNWKAGLLLNQSITGDLLHGFSVFGAGQYSRLVGDFKRSPIVSDRGSANQWVGAVGLAYTW